MNEDLLVLTTYDIKNAEVIEHLGIVQGSTVRARNFGSDMFASLKNIVGGFSGVFKTINFNKRAGL